MIKFENVKVEGFEPAIRGMRNPKNSWAKSDSHRGICGDGWSYDPGFIIGPADKELMLKLNKGGPVHAKYRRQIVVWVDITAPLYWWKEFDTYRFGRERNSCSTMHKIAEREFTEADFSNEHLDDIEDCTDLTDRSGLAVFLTSRDVHKLTIQALNYWRNEYLKATEAKDTVRTKHCWWQLIQLNPDCYNQRATIMMSYEVLANIRQFRKNHKLDEWADEFMEFIDQLPYSWIITSEYTISNADTKESPDNQGSETIRGHRLTDDESNMMLLREIDNAMATTTDVIPPLNICTLTINTQDLPDPMAFYRSRKMWLNLNGECVGRLKSFDTAKQLFQINLVFELEPRCNYLAPIIENTWKSNGYTYAIHYNAPTDEFTMGLFEKKGC